MTIVEVVFEVSSELFKLSDGDIEVKLCMLLFVSLLLRELRVNLFSVVEVSDALAVRSSDVLEQIEDDCESDEYEDSFECDKQELDEHFEWLGF